MVLPFFENFPQIPCVPMEAFPAQISHPAAVLTVDRSNETALSRLAAMHGPKLVVPEVWRDLLPNCGILISSALSGGSFRQRLEDAVRSAPKRCWLLLDPMQEEFRLPCPDGQPHRIVRPCRQGEGVVLPCGEIHPTHLGTHRVIIALGGNHRLRRRLNGR